MPIVESVKIGTREIVLHKLRSALTMLGVIFGVAAVISTAAIGAGARDELNRQLATLGTNTVRIRAVELKGKELSDARRLSPYGITRAEIEDLRVLLGDYLVAAAPLKKMSVQTQSGTSVLPFDVYGTSDELPQVSGYSMSQGRFISRLDETESRNVAVIGQEVRRRAFPLADPLAGTLIINGQPFTVVGVMASRGQASSTVINVQDIDRTIYLPMNSALRRLGQDDPRMDRLDEVVLKVREERHLREVAALTERFFIRRHQGVADFQVIVPEELIRQQQETKNVLSRVLIFIAAISLLVGGIGIMNIMLATVTQRTREIGIRRALGATRRDILLQFLVESLVISLFGGLVGIGVGFLLAFGIGNYANWPTIVPPESVVVSTTISALVGFLFGLYPSMRAARLDPIEALRTE